MATWARGVNFNNSANTRIIGGVGTYGNDGTAEKVYLGLGSEPWNNQGLELTSSTIKFKGKDISLSDHGHSGYASSTHNHDNSYLKLSGGIMTGHLAGVASTGPIAQEGQGAPSYEVRTTGSNAAYMTFHRAGNYAVRFGLDTDNKLKVGGWSMGNAAYSVYHEGNKPTPEEIGAVSGNHTHKQVYYNDTRNTEHNNSVFTDFKVTFQAKGTNGVSIGNSWYTMMHIPQYADSSGGYGSQIAFIDPSTIWFRKGISATTWSGWHKIYHTGDRPTASDCGALASTNPIGTGSLKLTGYGKAINLGTGTGDCYIVNESVQRYLQFRDDGVLNYGGTFACAAASSSTDAHVMRFYYDNGHYAGLWSTAGERINLHRYNRTNGGWSSVFSFDLDGAFVINHKTYLRAGSTGHLAINTSYGNCEIGPMNGSHCHIYTDRPSFWFNRNIYTEGRIYPVGGGQQTINSDLDGTNSVNFMKRMQNQYGTNYIHVAGPYGAHGIDVWGSDIKLKKDIIELGKKSKLKSNEITGLDLIKKIKHYSYRYKEFDKNISIGYIGQQLEEVDDRLVLKVAQDEDSPLCTEDDKFIRQPSVQHILPHVTKAIQEQQAIIDNLINEINKLKAIN